MEISVVLGPDARRKPAEFGAALAMHGSRLTVGAPRENVGGQYNVGYVYAYELADSEPRLVQRLGSGLIRSRFGDSVAWLGDRLVVSHSIKKISTFELGDDGLFASASPLLPGCPKNKPSWWACSGDMFGVSTGEGEGLSADATRLVAVEYGGYEYLGLAHVYRLESGQPSYVASVSVHDCLGHRPEAKLYNMHIRQAALAGERLAIVGVEDSRQCAGGHLNFSCAATYQLVEGAYRWTGNVPEPVGQVIADEDRLVVVGSRHLDKCSSQSGVEVFAWPSRPASRPDLIQRIDAVEGPAAADKGTLVLRSGA